MQIANNIFYKLTRLNKNKYYTECRGGGPLENFGQSIDTCLLCFVHLTRTMTRYCDTRPLCSVYLTYPMTRYAAVGSQQPRKRKKPGASYGSIDFDAVSARKRQAEDVRTWDVSASGAGRVSAKRKNRQHLHDRPQEHSHQEPALEEPILTPWDPQPDDTSSATSLAKSKKVRARKGNDSVGFALAHLLV